MSITLTDNSPITLADAVAYLDALYVTAAFAGHTPTELQQICYTAWNTLKPRLETPAKTPA